MQDKIKFGDCLNNIHDVLRKNERNNFYAGILGSVLSLIPVIGGSIAAGSSASAEILLSMSQMDHLELGADTATCTVNYFLNVDLSNFKSVGVLTSEHFVSFSEHIGARKEGSPSRD